MSAQTDGGPAFPLGGFEWTNPVHNNGMTLRDYFAAKALVGLADHIEVGVLFPQDVAEDCYRIADAMLAARQGGAK